jgi:transcriptional regulator with XRE-family HTH domain
MSEPSGGLAEALVDWRQQHGLSRLPAARRLGVARTTLRHREVSGVRPQPLQLIRIAEALGRPEGQGRAAAGPDRVRTTRTSGGAAASALCRARLAVGLTTTQLAREVGAGPATVSRWETGVRTPSPAQRLELAHGLPRGSLTRPSRAAANPVPSRSAAVDMLQRQDGVAGTTREGG